MCPDLTVAYRTTPWPTGLVTLRNGENGLFRTFPAFPAFSENQAALAYRSDRSGQNGQNHWNTLVYGFWPFQDPWVPLDPDTQRVSGSPTPGRLNCPGPAGPGLLGLHTARFPETASSAFSEKY